MIDENEIGKKIRQLREEQGVSQSDLGKALGHSHAAISDIERGKTRLTVRDLRIIADYFSISISEILGDSPLKLIHNRDSKNMTPEEHKTANIKVSILSHNLALVVPAELKEYLPRGTLLQVTVEKI